MKTIQKYFSKSILLFMFAILFTACGGSGSSDTTTNNNTQVRALRGQVGSASLASASLSRMQVSAATSSPASVEGITVIATDTSGNTVQATTDASGQFTMNLTVGETYVLSFVQNGNFIGTLIFKMGGLDAQSFKVTVGDEMNIGVIACSAGACESTDSTQQVSCQIDDNGNDVPDCDDSEMADQRDSNHDGKIDDGEGDHHGNTNDCEVIRMEPFDGEMGVDLNAEMKIRFSNNLADNQTLDSSLISLTGPAGLLSITYQVEDGREVKLSLAANLDPLTQYTLQISKNIQCANGLSPAADLSTQFTTGDSGSQESGDH